jgi:hypothetical protein
MKKLFLVSMLTILSSNIFADNVYCPKYVKCISGHCNFIPTFRLSPKTKQPIPDKTYSFKVANYPTLFPPDTCTYDGIGLDNVNLKPNTTSPGNGWGQNVDSKWLCSTNDPSKCPFI